MVIMGSVPNEEQLHNSAKDSVRERAMRPVSGHLHNGLGYTCRVCTSPDVGVCVLSNLSALEDLGLGN